MLKGDDDEFFIGYAPPMPPRLARFVKSVVLGVGALSLALGATLAAGHVPLDGGMFEFGRPMKFAGTLVDRPYPSVRLDGPESTGMPLLLLVAPGKHGADALVQGMGGRHITFAGTRIRRGTHMMIEVVPESLVVSQVDPSDERVLTFESLANTPIEVTGEIVDSKCFLGVMVPGSGKTHKECASLCLRGGIPPALFAQDRDGHSALLLLTGPQGESVTGPATLMAGEAIAVTGIVHREGGWLVLQTDPASWRRIQN